MESAPECARPEYDDSSWETFDLPNYWNARVNTASGFAWFRLKVINVNQAGEGLGVFLEKMQNAGRLFINGRQVMRDGTPGTSRETTKAGGVPQVAELPNTHEYVIAWQIANFQSKYGGPRHAPVIGLHRNLVRSLWILDSKDIFILGFVFMMVVYNLILWLMRMKEKASLFFALACFAIAGRLMIVAPVSQRLFWDADLYAVRTLIEVIAIVLSFAFTANGLGHLYPREISRRFLLISNVFTGVMIAVIAFIPGFLESIFINFFYIPIVLFGVWGTIVLFLAAWRRRQGAKLMLAGVFALMACLGNDLIATAVPAYPNVKLLGFGLMGIVLSYSAFLSFRFARLSSNLEREVDRQTAQITEQKGDLERLIKEKTDIFINFNHETKTPLTLMSNYLDKYIADRGEDENLAVIRRNLDKLLHDVSNSLDLEKLIRNQAFYRHDRPTALTALVREKVQLFEPTARRKGIQLSCAEAPALYTKIDPCALDRILNNLLDNAVRCTEAGGKIAVDLTLVRGRLELSVADTGKGIPAKQQKKIFEPYYQISQTKGNLQGMGMGLSIVKRIMESLGGDIRVESREGAGSRFILTFAPCDAPAESGKDESRLELSRPLTTETVRLREETYEEGKDTLLVIEDNKNMLAYLQESLAGEYNVFYACSGREAVKKLETMPAPQLIVSDVMMDEMDGYEFLDVLLASERHKAIPLVFLSARGRPEEKLDGLERGAVDVIRKPFSLVELKSKIRSLIQNRKSQRESVVRELQEKLGDLLAERREEKPTAALNEDLFDKFKITRREREIVQFLLQGLEYKEIAERMGVSFNTVRPYVSAIYKKCSVKNKVELTNLFKAK